MLQEGPAESAKEALVRVKFLMENPFDKPLLINFEADTKICDTWYEGK